MKLKILMILSALVAGVMSVFAADGTWAGGETGSKKWNTDTRYWTDQKPAGGSRNDTAYLHSAANGSYSYSNKIQPRIEIDQDVMLHSIEVFGDDGYPWLQLSRYPDFKLQMGKNDRGENPCFRSSPVWQTGNDQGVVFSAQDNPERRSVNLIVNADASADDSVFTFQGGAWAFRDGKAASGTYVASGFSRVDLIDVYQLYFPSDSKLGIADGDLRLVRAKFNFEAAADGSTKRSVSGGDWIVGPGVSYLVAQPHSGLVFPSQITRESGSKGFFTFGPTRNTSAVTYELPNPEQYYNNETEKRFPTWFLFGTIGSASGPVWYKFDFLTYQDGVFQKFTNYATSLSGATDERTVELSGATTLEGESEAAALKMQGKLTLAEGAKLTLGNAKEPGVLLYDSDLDGAGEITFKGSEGVLAALAGGRNINAKLTGDNSITILSGYDVKSYNVNINNEGNTFSGGLDILSGNVFAKKSMVLGTGRVTVDGFPGCYDGSTKNVVSRGATLTLDSGVEISNPISLAGTGTADSGTDDPQYCALFLKGASKVAGDITLNNATAIRCNETATEISGAISGDHLLYLWPAKGGVLTLAGDVRNGKEIAITSPTNMTRGTVSVSEGTQFNVAKLRNDATLRFKGARTFDGVLTGEGTLELPAAGALTLTTADVQTGALSGEGTLTLAADAPRLTIGSDSATNAAPFSGTIATVDGRALTLVKTGANTQTFGGRSMFSGDVVIEEGVLCLTNLADTTGDVLPETANVTVQAGGTLDLAGVSQTIARLENYGTITNSSAKQAVLTVKDGILNGEVKGDVKVVVADGRLVLGSWRTAASLPVTDGLAFHLDGADLSSLVRNDEGEVLTWKDASGNGNDFSAEEKTVYHDLLKPVYDATLNDGRGAVVFRADQTQSLATRLSMGEKTCQAETLFFMTRTDTTSTDYGNEGKKFYMCGLFGVRNEDGGIRLKYNDHKTWDKNRIFSNSRFYVNDNANNSGTFTAGEDYILKVDVLTNENTKAWSLGNYYPGDQWGNGPRGYNGTISEVIAYKGSVTAEERTAINAYLNAKWKTGEVTSCTLPEDLQIELGTGGTLDLAGTTQTLNGISTSGGSIVNGTITVTGTLNVVIGADGKVQACNLNGATLADGLTIAFTGGTLTEARYVVATGVASADVSKMKVPSGWNLSLSSDGELVLAKGGMCIILR